MAYEAASSTGNAPAAVRTPRRHRWPIILIAMLGLALVFAGVWQAWPRSTSFYTDGRDLRVPAAAASPRAVLWRDPIALPPEINSPGDDYEPCFSEDGATLFFARGKTGGTADIFSAHRIGDAWSAPAPVSAINTGSDELGPRLSADGLALYFYSDRPGGVGGYDLWMSRCGARDAVFEVPVNLGARANSSWDDYGPAPSPDGAVLYFASNRPRDPAALAPESRWSATLREDRDRRGYDLYAAPITAAGFGLAVPLAALNTTFDEGTPTVSPVGDFLYFSSNRPGGAGGFDLYRARIRPNGFSTAERLGDAVNSTANELDPALSMGGFALHYSSDRPTGEAPSPAERHYDIYHTTSREVFADVEILQAGFDWDGLWSVLVPGLLALLLLLLLLLLGGPLWNAAQRRRLSLIMRCLLASLLLHTLLLAVFTVWQVSTSLSGLFKRPGGVQVALTSAAHAADFTDQLRGGFTMPLESLLPAESSIRAQFEPVPAQTWEEPLAAPQRSNVAAPPSEMQSAVADARANTQRPAQVDRQLLNQPLSAANLIAPKLPAAPEPVLSTESSADAPVVARPAPAVRGELPQSTPEPDVASTGVALPPAPVVNPSPAAAFDPAARICDAAATAPALAARAPGAPALLSPATSPAFRLPFAATPPLAPADEHTEPAPQLALAALRPQRLPSSSAAAPQEVVLNPPPPRLGPIDAGAVSQWESQPTHDAQVVAMSAPALKPSVVAAQLPAPAVELTVTTPPTANVPRSEPPEPHSSASARPSLAGLRPSVATAPPSSPSPGAAPLPLPAASAPTIATNPTQPLKPSALPDAPPPQRQITAGPRLPIPRLADGPLNIPNIVSPPAPHHAVTGVVIDAHTREPLSAAQVRLDLSDGATVAAQTDAAGAYTLSVPPMPDFFVISASADGYLPASANVSAEAVRSGALQVHFHLRRADLDAIAIEAAPDVHHLGDDRFEGSVNSQFQKRSEGGRYSATFELSRQQVAPYVTGGDLVMLTRGVQMPHPIYLNGNAINLRLTHSPHDGSFGEYRASFDVSALHAGANTLEIRALSRGGDIDDFEFVNVQIRLDP